MKPIVLTLTNFFLPGFRGGGPIRSLQALGKALSDEFDFRIVTADHDYGDHSPYPNMVYRRWKEVEAVQVQYLPPPPKHWKELFRVLKNGHYDVLYLNDFFSPHWSIWPLFLLRAKLIPRRRVLVSPRGQFMPGALAIRASKKVCYLFMAKQLGFFSDITWHATNEVEAAEIRGFFGKNASILTAPVLPTVKVAPRDVPDRLNRFTQRQPLKLIFVSRISPKKNLSFAIRVLRRLSIPIDFDIFGPVDDRAYWESVKGSLVSLPPNIRATYKGELPYQEAQDIYSNYCALLFPTLGENFGHVIYEALASGCLPIISNTTPWLDLGIRKCGWVLPVNEETAFEKALEELNDLLDTEFYEMRSNARKYAAEYLALSGAAELNRAIFRSLCKITQTVRVNPKVS